MRRVLLVGVTLLLTAAPAVAAAPEDLANRIAGEVMSPYCPGVSLHDCPSAAALDLRADIESWARQGMTHDEIIARLQAEFGPTIVGVPPRSGGGLLVWLLPGAVLAAGLVGAFLLSRRWTPGDGGSPPVGRRSDDQQRLEAELLGVRERLWWRA